MKEFQYLLPIILALGNKDLKEQHWNQMSSQVHPTINSTKQFSINDLIGLEIFNKKDILMEISQKATGQQLIENQIANIHKKWDELNFNIITIDNNQNKLKISGIDDII